MKDPRITSEVQDQIEDSIISSFLSTEFMKTHYVDHEDIDVDFDTTTEGVITDQVLLTLAPMDTKRLQVVYDEYVFAANKWAIPRGLFLSNIYAGDLAHEITFVFDIVDLNKILKLLTSNEQLGSTEQSSDLDTIFSGIKDRLTKIEKHSMEFDINPSDKEELKAIYTRLQAIESSVDQSIAGSKKTGTITTMAQFGKKFWATLIDRNGKIKHRMEVSFKEEDYAKSAFQAAGVTVIDTDTVKFE